MFRDMHILTFIDKDEKTYILCLYDNIVYITANQNLKLKFKLGYH